MLDQNDIRLLTATPEINCDTQAVKETETNVLYAIDTRGQLWQRTLTWSNGYIVNKTDWRLVD